MAIERKKQKKQSRTVATAAIPMVMLALTRYASTRNSIQMPARILDFFMFSSYLISGMEI